MKVDYPFKLIKFSHQYNKIMTFLINMVNDIYLTKRATCDTDSLSE